MPPLTLDVAGRDVTFDEPAQARAAGRRWQRMARELDTPGAPAEAREKAQELRQRAKAAQDWARGQEDRATRTKPVGRVSSPDHAPARPGTQPGRAGARQALHESGVRRTRKAASRSPATVRRAVRRYQRAGGPTIGIGNLAIYLIGGAIGVVLLEDVLSARGSKSLAAAGTAVTTIAGKVIAPVPLIAAGAPTPTAAPAANTAPSPTTKAGPSPVQPLRPGPNN